MDSNKKVPALQPSQFDDYIFQNWKPEVSGFYERFHIERIENYSQHLKLPLEPHRRSVYFFLFVTKGKAYRSKGLTEYEIKTNHFFFLPADQITALRAVSPDIEGFYCHFLPGIFNQQHLKTDLSKDFNFYSLSGYPVVPVNHIERYINILQILEKEYKDSNPKRFEIIPYYLLSLFKEVSLEHSEHRPPAHPAHIHLTTAYKDLLTVKIGEINSVKDFATLLEVTPNHLNKSVKLTTGKSAHALLDEMRMLEAKVLLKQTDLSIAEIAFKTGKSDPSDFSRFFKLNSGQSPREFRQKPER